MYRKFPFDVTGARGPGLGTFNGASLESRIDRSIDFDILPLILGRSVQKCKRLG